MPSPTPDISASAAEERKGDSHDDSAEERSIAAQPDQIITVCDISMADTVVQLTTQDGQVIHYIVYRAPMRLASIVFEIMLDPGSRLPSIKKLSSPIHGNIFEYLPIYDDDPKSVIMFLRIVHLQFDKVPKSIPDLESFVRLADFCDKYDCVKVFDPWTDEWLGTWWPRALEPGHEAWLRVATIFGEPRNFTELTKSMAQHLGTTSPKVGELRTKTDPDLGGNVPLAWSHVPEKISTLLMKMRDDVMVELAAVVETHTRILKLAPALSVKSASPSFAGYRCTDSCMALCYGALIRSAQEYPEIRATLDKNCEIAHASLRSITPLEYLAQVKSWIGAMRRIWDNKTCHSNYYECELQFFPLVFDDQCTKIISEMPGLEAGKFMCYSKHNVTWEGV